jgi:hypothetical protein
MKKVYKKLIPFFGATFSMLKHPWSSLANKVETPKESFLSTSLDKKVKSENQRKDRQSLSFEREKTILNQTKVFLLVKKESKTKQKSERNLLLVLTPYDRLNSDKFVFRPLKRYLTLKVSNSTERPIIHWKNIGLARLYAALIKVRVYRPNEILPRRNSFPLLAHLFRGGKAYGMANQGGYKSICPVFFNENSAKDFLMANAERKVLEEMDLHALKNETEKKSFLNLALKTKGSIQEVKILRLGLGDFVEYYSTTPNEEDLKKVEFLFFPDFEIKTRKKKIKIKGFKAYQEQLYKTNNLKNT